MKQLITWRDGAGNIHRDKVDVYEGEDICLKDGSKVSTKARKIKRQGHLFEPEQRKLF